MVKKGMAAAAGIAVALIGGAALAGQGKWSRLDKDGDGKVAVSEIDRKHRDFIARADADKDGFITETEMGALREARKAEWRAKRFPDANKDGAVDRSEFEIAARERFEALDQNKDGRLSEAEMAAGQHRGHRRGGRS
jgi:Ca2+-binding EF-hand superfamily protein